MKEKTLLAFAGLVLMLALPQQPAGRDAVTDGSWPAGSITGVVRFDSEYPRPETIKVTQDESVCGSSKQSQTFVVSPKNKGLANVVVTLEGVTGGKPPAPTDTATIVQDGCTYKPHLQVVELGAKGTQLVIHNEDGIMHNIHAFLKKRTLFNSVQPPKLKTLKKKLRRPGITEVKCDVHAWMNAYIVVLKDEPYHSVTGEAGQFTLDGVPPGTYTLHFWHEALGEMTREVTVTEGKAAKVDWVIKPKG
ncbi:MAG: carboxypeptidase regulatory-like domain-containing protein [Gemmatimonadales bacterium]